MKRLFLILAIIFFSAAISWATPFLVCDPYESAVGVTKFTGTLDGAAFEKAYSLHSSGAAIIYDMTGMNLNVSHIFADLKACNSVGCSDPAPSYTTPIRPAAPKNLKLVN